MKKILFLCLASSLIGLLGCATQGKITKINTMGGDTFSAIMLVSSMWDEVKLARNGNDFILYADVKTNGNSRPGALILTIDGNKNTIASPGDWHIENVSYAGYGQMVNDYRSNSVVSSQVINSLKNSNSLKIFSVNSNGVMHTGEGKDISKLLPAIKAFIE
ncbi:hypothetical protein FACS1894137_17800 [Spirochaetia bacterium]|nr:hypothetical protein FACS1894137_17800 [Spirochaetia bacterium]